jgi:DNA polymerase V
LFEVRQKLAEANRERLRRRGGRPFSGKSVLASELRADPTLEIDLVIAPPRMRHYMRCSRGIVDIYLRHVSMDDLLVYSIDEVFIDATPYLRASGMTAHEYTMAIIRDILDSTGITATAGIGSNLYLCKIAMDIEAKHQQPDADGVRIAELDEMSYRRALWDHRPLTDFWRVGRGIARKLEDNGLYTMGDVARCSLGAPGSGRDEELLFRLFGVNAELLIDHAWGVESCRISDIKAYRPASRSISTSQVLMTPYDFEKARLIVREMTEQMVLELVEKALVTDLVELYIGYDRVSLADRALEKEYGADAESDRYGRRVPKGAHGSARLDRYGSSSKLITETMIALYDRIADPALSVRRVTIAACELEDESFLGRESEKQLDLFGEMERAEDGGAAEKAALEDERKRQRVMLDIRKKYGKNAILKGTNLEKGATARDRNRQIGGHKA